jgi:hypothetical protein
MGHASDPVGAESRAAGVPTGRLAAPTTAPGAAILTGLRTARGAQALQRAIGNAAMGRLLARSMLDMDAPAEREIGPNDRPPSKWFFEAYSKVSYDVWKRGQNPPGVDEEKQQNGAWEFIGGSVGQMFGASDPDNPAAGPKRAKHTCAGRLSWALNHSGYVATEIKSGTIFYNDPKVTYAGTPGDGKNYIVGAPAMQAYLTKQWGRPDVTLSNLDVYATDPATGTTTKTAGDASALRASLGPEKIAVFAGAHHVGVISQKLNTDDYIYYDRDVVPAVAWILP